METHGKINNFEVAMEWKQIRTGLIEHIVPKTESEEGDDEKEATKIQISGRRNHADET
jgi:hypothetical protein